MAGLQLRRYPRLAGSRKVYPKRKEAILRIIHRTAESSRNTSIFYCYVYVRCNDFSRFLHLISLRQQLCVTISVHLSILTNPNSCGVNVIAYYSVSYPNKIHKTRF